MPATDKATEAMRRIGPVYIRQREWDPQVKDNRITFTLNSRSQLTTRAALPWLCGKARGRMQRLLAPMTFGSCGTIDQLYISSGEPNHDKTVKSDVCGIIHNEDEGRVLVKYLTL